MALCTSPFFCPGSEILASVQTSRVFADSKTFVDRPTLFADEVIIAHWGNLSLPYTKIAISHFIDKNFGHEGHELIPLTPADFMETPPFIDYIKDNTLKLFGKEINEKWKLLFRADNKEDIRCQYCHSSLLQVPNPFIVPGGRFRETYYWDQFFIQEGLLKSGLVKTTKGILMNFLGIVEKYGFFPNGLRCYYLNRSQPPFLIQMVDAYFKHTNDLKLLKRFIPILRKEYEWWMKNRIVTVQGHVFNIYKVVAKYPRPEAFVEDKEIGERLNGTVEEIYRIYGDIAAAAESGWDFSSRWISSPVEKDQAKNLERHITSSIVPIDLNSLMFMNEQSLAKIYQLDHQYEEAEKMRENARKGFYDYNIQDMKFGEFSPANYWPEWASIQVPDYGSQNRCVDILDRYSAIPPLLDEYKGGIPTTLIESGLQWDLPNSWPPLQYSTLKAMQNTRKNLSSDCPNEHDIIQKMENTIAQNYLNSVFCGWRYTGGFIKNAIPKLDPKIKTNGFFFEKFHSLVVGKTGHGGEYDPQEGFGWTNGIMISILSEYGSVLELPDCPLPQGEYRGFADEIGVVGKEASASVTLYGKTLKNFIGLFFVSYFAGLGLIWKILS